MAQKVKNARLAEEHEEDLAAIPFAKPLRVRVTRDIGGYAVFGTSLLRGITGSGRSRAQALRDFFDNVITEYYEFVIKPPDFVVDADDARAARLREIFYPKRERRGRGGAGSRGME